MSRFSRKARRDRQDPNQRVRIGTQGEVMAETSNALVIRLEPGVYDEAPRVLTVVVAPDAPFSLVSLELGRLAAQLRERGSPRANGQPD